MDHRYRHVFLEDSSCRKIPGASLFLKIEFVDVISNDPAALALRRGGGGSRRNIAKQTLSEMLETGIPMADSQFAAFSADLQRSLSLSNAVAVAVKTFCTQAGAKNKVRFP